MKKLLVLFLLSVLPLMAQTDRATMTGTVTDPSGRRVVGANLVITSDTTGLERLAKTNEAGIYTVASLATGTYKVAVEAAGFAPYLVEGLTLDVGQTRTLNAKLAVEGTSTQIEVSPDSGLSRSSAEIGGVVHGRQAQDLPLNGRSYVGLVSLVPGAIDSGTGTQQDVRFAGLSDEDNTWHLDGVDNSGINHQYQKVDLHLQVSTEAIAEFRANGVAYSADQGGSIGGQIEVVSKTGGDEYHGAAWEFIRNNVFDAAPWGAHGLLPPLRLNNFGANIGGPILKKKLFFFANYEALRQNIDQVLTGTVPSASYRAQVAAAQPVLAPLINAYPIGQVVISPTSMTWFGSGSQITHEDSGLIRADYHFSDRMSVFARFNTDHYTQTAPDGLAPSRGFNNLNTPNATIGVQNTFTPKFFNDFRYGFDRAEFLQGQNTPFAFALQISPFTSIGNPSGSIRNDNSFTALDDATFLFGRHTLKAGVTVRSPISNLTAQKYVLTQAQAPGFGYPVNPDLGATSASSSPSGAPINRRDTAVDEWTLSVQQEVAKQTIFQMAYFGTSVSHAFSDTTLNGINSITGKRPYAGFSTIDYRGTFDHASTNAFQASIQRNMSTGLLISANYEWSHSIDNGGIGGGEADGPENVACTRCERASSDQDMRSYFSASTIWRLPVGKGHAILGNASRSVNLLLGGWQLSGIASARSGLPLNVTISRSASALPDQLNKGQRPNRVPGVSLYPANKTPRNWLNPAALSAPANGTWGNLGRNAVRAPGLWQLDPSLNKRFPITERIGLNFRAEAFNVLNRAQYGHPAVSWAPPQGAVANPNNYGVITGSYNTNPTGSGTPRELQFSLKAEF